VPDLLRSSDFSPCLRTHFYAQQEGGEPIPLELSAVTELGESSVHGGRRPFALLLLGPVSRHYLPQGTYPMRHEAMGGLDLFIVPIGPETGRMRYEVVFN
jgi:hypothetical protein